jgi:hypothetical protein
MTLESSRIHRNFIESDEVDTHNKNVDIIEALLHKMDDVREATVSVTEVNLNSVILFVCRLILTYI